MRIHALLLTLGLLCGHAIAADLPALKTRLTEAMVKHLNLLLGTSNKVPELKGKTADGQEALAFYQMYQLTHDPRYRTAALDLADRVLKDMRAMKFGVLPIKEKEKEGGKTFMGGGPPALGFYTVAVAFILRSEGGRNDDLKYLAKVLDEYPWSENGWWSADIDVITGEPKVPLSKPSIINKSASIAMATGAISAWVAGIDPERSARLKQKTDKCLYEKIIPAQLPDGFWHYSLADKDPKDKDILGYFMLTTEVLMNLQQYNPAYRESRLNSALQKAQTFALKCIAPMTDPNTGPACDAHTTRSTPQHYTLVEEPKRGFQLSQVLLGAGHLDEGIKILDASLAHFPYGNAGSDGVHAAAPIAGILSRLP